MFNNTWLCRYLHSRKVVFDNGSEFEQDFTNFLKVFYIETVLTPIKNPQSNIPLDLEHQLILNMLLTKDLDNTVFDQIYPWGETLPSIEL